MGDVLARKLANDPAAKIRRRNLIKKEQFPYRSALGWEMRQRQLPRHSRRLSRPSPIGVFATSSGTFAKPSPAN
jgi:hypothetical protein